ncbi:MAG: hypothetical protein PHW75_03110 [Patescibacteria group bacterium]|nr:hypothetical protein [Patescibacteria group bacterium]
MANRPHSYVGQVQKKQHSPKQRMVYFEEDGDRHPVEATLCTVTGFTSRGVAVRGFRREKAHFLLPSQRILVYLRRGFYYQYDHIDSVPEDSVSQVYVLKRNKRLYWFLPDPEDSRVTESE